MLVAEVFANCLAAAASLCIMDSASVQLTRSTIWSGAIIQIEGVRVESVFSTDSVVMPQIGDMNVLCSDSETCTYYRGNCSTNEEERVCTLWYTFGEQMALRKIELRGAEDQIEHVLPRLKLVRSEDALIGLSELSYDATDALPPTCRTRQGCRR
jgi:hypothetical protein